MSSHQWRRWLDELVATHRATLEVTGGNHFLIVLPNGRRVVAAKTPGDHRSMLNVRALVRRLARQP